MSYPYSDPSDRFAGEEYGGSGRVIGICPLCGCRVKDWDDYKLIDVATYYHDECYEAATGGAEDADE